MGKDLQQYDCNQTADQQWEVVRTGFLAHTVIYNNKNGLCMADKGGWIGNGMPVDQEPCNGSISEIWIPQLDPKLNVCYLFNLKNVNEQDGMRALAVNNYCNCFVMSIGALRDAGVETILI